MTNKGRHRVISSIRFASPVSEQVQVKSWTKGNENLS